MIYADAEYYTTEYAGKCDVAELDFKSASRHIDSLTYNRITDFNALTEFQQRVIRECACMMADFEAENGDIINSVLKSYTLNGASLTFGGSAAIVVNGVCIRRDIYAYLQQSGLCVGVMR